MKIELLHLERILISLLTTLSMAVSIVKGRVIDTSATCPSSITLPLSSAAWVWTNEVSSPTDTAPVGARAFRGRLPVPLGHTATGATVTISVDNEFVVWVQGQVVGSGTDWTRAQAFSEVQFTTPTTEVIVAVQGTNTGAEAGVIALIQLTLDCGSSVGFTTDRFWKFNLDVPDGFQDPTFDDSEWSTVEVQGIYGVQPWGNIPTQVA